TKKKSPEELDSTVLTNPCTKTSSIPEDKSQSSDNIEITCSSTLSHSSPNRLINSPESSSSKSKSSASNKDFSLKLHTLNLGTSKSLVNTHALVSPPNSDATNELPPDLAISASEMARLESTGPMSKSSDSIDQQEADKAVEAGSGLKLSTPLRSRSISLDNRILHEFIAANQSLLGPNRRVDNFLSVTGGQIEALMLVPLSLPVGINDQSSDSATIGSVSSSNPCSSSPASRNDLRTGPLNMSSPQIQRLNSSMAQKGLSVKNLSGVETPSDQSVQTTNPSTSSLVYNLSSLAYTEDAEEMKFAHILSRLSATLPLDFAAPRELPILQNAEKYSSIVLSLRCQLDSFIQAGEYLGRTSELLRVRIYSVGFV
ncbi:unnamed protein product, partial [Protopolystoma xenopodis]